MRYRKGHRSADVEDRRHQRGGGRMRIPLPGGGRRGGARLGCGGIVVLLLLSVIFKQDFFSLLVGAGGGVATTPTSRPSQPTATGPDPEAELVSAGPRRARPQPGHVGTDSAAPRHPVPARQAGALPRRRAVSVRLRAIGHRPVLLSGRREGLHRSQLLRRALPPLRRPRRFRPGLRLGPRDRPPCADGARHLETGAADAGPQPEAEEPAVGGHGAPGRLPAGVWARSAAR